MELQILKLDELYILNQCTKFLARTNTDNRHNFGQFNDDSIRAQIAESWRFPLLDSYSDGNDPINSYNQNRVTFIYRHLGENQPQSVSVVGSFANLYEAIPLQPVTFLVDGVTKRLKACRSRELAEYVVKKNRSR